MANGKHKYLTRVQTRLAARQAAYDAMRPEEKKGRKRPGSMQKGRAR